ncbi:unnamed protein product [Oncorhynchus mykiss]|uniref:Transmembrane protein 107 n=1 Tax=Oncorhynchus mykiss TaxID=8022 RepID=A0A060YV75_ONCMY|nr:unnamed protein product [Oncorhynchus mykiss]
MSAVSSLVPARFLTLTAHLVIVITIFWSRVCSEYWQGSGQTISSVCDMSHACIWHLEDTNSLTQDSLPIHHPCIHLSIHTLATAAHASASVALLFFLFEQWACEIYWWILAFCRLVSLAVHCSASISLSFFVFQRWECWTYWVIFAFCSVLPAFVEILLFIAVFGLKKKPL